MLLGLGLLVPFCAAQVLQDHTHDAQQAPPSNNSRINTKPKKRGPRALGVVEFLPGGKARLVPVALWIDDHFYDASLYAANPAPMAIEPETVYEATDYGEPTGLFTVTSPEEIKGSWVAIGDWKPHLALDEKIAQQKAKQPKPKPKEFDVNADRPVLKRGSNASPDNSSPSASGSQQTIESPGPEPPDRPVLKKPEPATSPDSASASASTSAPAGSASSTAPSPDESDPNRPVLRRGAQPQRATTAAAPSDSDTMNAKMTAAQAKLAGAISHRSYPAISDAGAYETRSLLYAMNSTERAGKADQMRALALEEIGKFIAKRKTPALPKNAVISDYDLRAYDLDYSNSPTFVLTATLPVTGAKAFSGGEFDYYVTVVARADINDMPIKIFSTVSDSNHLDAFPRLEMVDAVDADANGRGDLLFRQHSDSGISYSLYRVYPYDMQKVFEGGASL